MNNNLSEIEDRIIIAPKSKVHGDELILIYENYIKKSLLKYQDITFIEIGSERGTGSTFRLSKLCNKNKWKFITIDADEGISKNAENIVKRINNNFEAINDLGEVFLKNYQLNNIGICYLDAFDIVTDWPHKESSVETYRKRNVEITNKAAYQMHLEAAQNCYSKILPGGFICFDDVWLDKENFWQGKGKTAIPFLLSNGFETIAYKNNSLLLQNMNDIDELEKQRLLTISKKINLNNRLIINRIKKAPKKILNRYFIKHND